jgi:hypothetical protein
MEVNISKNNIINSVTIFWKVKNTIKGHLIGTITKGGQQLDPVTFTCTYYEHIILI